MKRTAILLSLMLVATSVHAQPESTTPKLRCSVSAIDSRIYGSGEIHRDCDVDQPAKLIDAPRPAVKLQQDPICVFTELEFAVDEEGRPIAATARSKRGNSRKFTELTLKSLPDWRYSPAIKNGIAVRQVVKARVARENEKLLTVTLMRPGDRPPPPGPNPPCV